MLIVGLHQHSCSSALLRTIANTGGLQVPRAEYRIVGREEIYLSGDPSRRSRAEMALLSACDQILAKARLLVDGIPRGAMPGLTAIDPGRHEIEVQAEDGSVLARRTMTFEAGTTLPVESLFQTERRSRVAVTMGGVARFGTGTDSFHRLAPELELGWMDPLPTPDWLRLETHIRLDAAAGSVPEQAESTTVLGGFTAMGASVGLQAGGFSIGPLAEGVLAARSFTNESGAFRQGQVTHALGGRAMLTRPLGKVELLVRIDSRYTPFTVADEDVALWHHGVAVGVTSAP